MKRSPLIALSILVSFAAACVSRETYLVPYPALSSLSTLGPGRYETTAVPGRRDGTDDNVFVKASTLDLNNVQNVEDSVKINSAQDRPVGMFVASIISLVVGAAGIITGAYLLATKDDTETVMTGDPPMPVQQRSHGDGYFYGGVAALAAGGAVFLTGGALLTVTLVSRPQEVGESKRNMLYLDPTGRIPSGSSASITLRIPF